MPTLEGKIAIITGAGSGIGRATALRFAAEGAAVMSTDIDEESAQQTAAEIARTAGSAAAYQASKHGVVGLTRSFAVAYAPYGVRVNAVAPGWVESPPMKASLERNPDMRELGHTLHPMARIAQPEEIAAAVQFLASDDASFVTGVTLPVDGGYTAAITRPT